MLVYLCGPIDQCGCSADIYNWRKLVKNKLNCSNFNVFDAASAFSISNRRQNFDELYLITKTALIKSNIILAYIPPDMPTIGTFTELQTAKEYNIPVYIAMPNKLKDSMILSALLSKNGKIFKFLNDAIETLITENKEGASKK